MSLATLYPDDAVLVARQFSVVGCASPVDSSDGGPITDPNAFSRSPAATLAAAGATFPVTVEYASPRSPAAKSPPPPPSA